MPTPSLELKGIDGYTLLKVLAGVQSPLSIKLAIELPTEAGHESNSIRIYTDTNELPRLRMLVEALKEKGDLELPIFSISLSERATQLAFAHEDTEEIRVPDFDAQKWKKISRQEKHRFILQTVKSELSCNLTELSSRLGVARSHVSNVLNGKRSLGWKALNKLMENFPLSIEMKELVKEARRDVQSSK
jgi:hypothetical protein